LSGNAPSPLADTRDLARVALAEFLGVLLLLFISLGAIIAALSVSQGDMNAAGSVAIAFGLTIAFLVSATASIRVS